MTHFSLVYKVLHSGKLFNTEVLKISSSFDHVKGHVDKSNGLATVAVWKIKFKEKVATNEKSSIFSSTNKSITIKKQIKVMKEITRTIEEVVELVKGNYSSVFSKEDVLNLIQSIEVAKEPNVTKESLVNFITEYIENEIERLDSDDVVDTHSVEFCLNGNEIGIDSINIDSDQLSRELLGGIDDAVDMFLKNDL